MGAAHRTAPRRSWFESGPLPLHPFWGWTVSPPHDWPENEQSEHVHGGEVEAFFFFFFFKEGVGVIKKEIVFYRSAHSVCRQRQTSKQRRRDRDGQTARQFTRQAGRQFDRQMG